MNSRVERTAEEARGSQAEWLGMLETLAQQTAQQWMEQAQEQQQAFQQQAQEQQQSFQQMTQEVLSSYAQLLNIPLSYAQEGLRSARFPIEGYDELTVDELSAR